MRTYCFGPFPRKNFCAFQNTNNRNIKFCIECSSNSITFLDLNISKGEYGQLHTTVLQESTFWMLIKSKILSECAQKRARSTPGSELLHKKKRAASGQEPIYFVLRYSSLANCIKRIRLQTGFLAKVIPFSGKFLPSFL